MVKLCNMTHNDGITVRVVASLMYDFDRKHLMLRLNIPAVVTLAIQLHNDGHKAFTISGKPYDGIENLPHASVEWQAKGPHDKRRNLGYAFTDIGVRGRITYMTVLDVDAVLKEYNGSRTWLHGHNRENEENEDESGKA